MISLFGILYSAFLFYSASECCWCVLNCEYPSRCWFVTFQILNIITDINGFITFQIQFFQVQVWKEIKRVVTNRVLCSSGIGFEFRSVKGCLWWGWFSVSRKKMTSSLLYFKFKVFLLIYEFKPHYRFLPPNFKYSKNWHIRIGFLELQLKLLIYFI